MTNRLTGRVAKHHAKSAVHLAPRRKSVSDILCVTLRTKSFVRAMGWCQQRRYQ